MPAHFGALAESLSASIAEGSIEAQGRQWQATASIGVSHFHQGDKTIDDVISRADTASYRAQQSERNKVKGDVAEQPKTTVPSRHIGTFVRFRLFICMKRLSGKMMLL